MAGEKLLKGLEKFQIKSDSENKIFEKLDKYIQEIILFNSAYNLTNTSDYDEISINHILDSISAAEQIKNLAKSLSKNEIKIADIGSGGGLPGIPLAIVLPEFQFFLVERMDKRCAFLENEKAILSLDNVTVKGFNSAIINHGRVLANNTDFVGNEIRYFFAEDDNGGAVRNFGSCDFVNCNFKDNLANKGGAIYNNAGNVNLIDCSFKGNKALLEAF